jgi:phosphotransferase system HPr-like phosphotransfer protein
MEMCKKMLTVPNAAGLHTRCSAERRQILSGAACTPGLYSEKRPQSAFRGTDEVFQLENQTDQ